MFPAEDFELQLLVLGCLAKTSFTFADHSSFYQ
jgi:hypothetical protein